MKLSKTQREVLEHLAGGAYGYGPAWQPGYYIVSERGVKPTVDNCHAVRRSTITALMKRRLAGMVWKKEPHGWVFEITDAGRAALQEANNATPE